MPEAIAIIGSFATKLKELCSDINIRPKLFEKYYDCYLYCAIYGLLNKRTAVFNPETDSNPKDTADIRSEVIIGQKGRSSYFTIRKIIILSENNRGYSFEEKIDNALRFDIPIEEDSDEYTRRNSKYNSNTELIHGFALGGIELFYQKVSEHKTPEDLIYFMRETEKKFKDAVGYDNGL